MKNTHIKLTEISRGKGDTLVEQPCLVNVEGIVLVLEGEFETGAIPIIGESRTDNKLREIVLTNGRSLFVAEELDAIHRLCGYPHYSDTKHATLASTHKYAGPG